MHGESTYRNKYLLLMLNLCCILSASRL